MTSGLRVVSTWEQTPVGEPESRTPGSLGLRAPPPPPSTEWDISAAASYRSHDNSRLDVSLVLSDTLHRFAAIMLDLTQAYTGCPSSSLQFLHLPRETLLVSLLNLYSSAGFDLAYRQVISVRGLRRRAQCAHPGLRPRSGLLGGISFHPSPRPVRAVSGRREWHETGT